MKHLKNACLVVFALAVTGAVTAGPAFAEHYYGYTGIGGCGYPGAAYYAPVYGGYGYYGDGNRHWGLHSGLHASPDAGLHAGTHYGYHKYHSGNHFVKGILDFLF